MEQKDTEEYLEQWENIVESVDKTDIPIRFVNRIIFDSNYYSVESNSKTNQLDIASLRDSGYPDEVIQEILNEVIREIADIDGTMDFLLNIEEIAIVAQSETDRYLHKRN